MQVAVSTVLAGNQLTPWDVFGDCRFWQASNRAGGPFLRPEAVPTDAEISGSRRW